MDFGKTYTRMGKNIKFVLENPAARKGDLYVVALYENEKRLTGTRWKYDNLGSAIVDMYHAWEHDVKHRPLKI